MIYQVYKNKELGRIIIHKKGFPFDENRNIGFELIDEVEGEDWNECSEKINKKYFSKIENEID
jgi:hypothetical protein